jgi:hypothetical protein
MFQMKNSIKVIADGEEAKREESQREATPPPAMEDNNDSECENENDFGISEEEHQTNVRRPGAFAIAGIDARQTSQQSFLYDDQGVTEEEEAKENVDEVITDPDRVVAEAVDEEKLFHEMLTRHAVVHAENVFVRVEDDINEDKITRSVANIKKRTIVAATLVVAVIAIATVVIAVLVSRSNSKQSKQPTPTTAPPQPTAAPVPRLEVFRSDLLNHNVSSRHELYQSGTVQNDALNWLANNDKFLNASSSVESIIDRYVLGVFYYADGGSQWNKPSNFLTNKSVCAWHSSTVANGTGVFCTTSKNGSLGNYATRLPYSLFIRQ